MGKGKASKTTENDLSESNSKEESDNTPETTKKRKATKISPSKSKDESEQSTTPTAKRRGRPTKAEQYMRRKMNGELDNIDKKPEGQLEKIAVTEFLQTFEQMSNEHSKRLKTFEYEEEIKKMMHSFGDIAHPQPESAHLLEILANIYLKHLMEQLVEETLKRHIRKNKNKKVSKSFLKQRVDLDEVALNLAAEKRARVKDVVSFLRRNKKIERTTQAVEEGWFQEEQDYEEFVAPNGEDPLVEGSELKEEEKVTVETFWDSVVVGEAQDKAKERKLERLKYRDTYTKNMTTQEYLYFADCTKVSFTRPSKRTKFSAWCKLNTYPISFGNECVDVLGQLVYEHVEEVIRSTLQELGELPSVGISPQNLLDTLKKKYTAPEATENKEIEPAQVTTTTTTTIVNTNEVPINN